MKNNWQTKTLGEVCEYIARGISPKYSESSGLMVINQKCIRDHVVNIDLARLHDIEQKSVSSEKMLRKGDVLINSTGTGTLGRVAQITDDLVATVDSHVTIVRPNKDIFDKRFFAWSLFYIEAEIEKSGAGASGQTELAREVVKSFLISYPSDIQEQRRIVKILDEAFEKIAKAEKNADMNLRNSKELFESYLQSAFTVPVDNWKYNRLGNVCDTGAGGTPLKSHKDYYEGGTVPWLRSGEVNKKEICESELFITPKGVANSSAKLFPVNTVLVAMYGATAGQVGILRFESTTNQAVCGILPNDNFLPEFIYYVFLAKKKELVDQAVGGAQPNISQIKIKNTSIPIPTLSEQTKIVKNLDLLSDQTRKLETNYKQKITDLDELKKALLSKVFAGEL